MLRLKIPGLPPPGKRIGQGGVVECDHEKTRGGLNGFGPDGKHATVFGDVCLTCGWKEVTDGGRLLGALRGIAAYNKKTT